MAALNNSDSELNLKKGFLLQYTLKQIFVDRCIPPPSPPPLKKRSLICIAASFILTMQMWSMNSYNSPLSSSL